MKNKHVIILAICTIFLSACSSNENKYDASGVFEATEVIVSAEASGKIISFNIWEGQEIEANQIVGLIDSVQLFLRKEQLTANLKALQNRRLDLSKQIGAVEEQLTAAKREKQRIENLFKENAVTQKQLDDVDAQVKVLEKQLSAQKSTIENTNKSLDEEIESVKIQIAQVNDQLGKCKIASPIKGTVLVKYAEQGELASIGRALFKIADLENMFLRAYITSSQLTKLKIGQEVKVFADFGEKETREYTGTITWISSKSEFTPKTIQTKDERANLVYAVKVLVKNDGYLKSGMYGGLMLQ